MVEKLRRRYTQYLRYEDTEMPAICPCCNFTMTSAMVRGYYFCDNDQCRFYLDAGVQAVLASMLEEYDDADKVVEACAIAREYTLSEKAAFSIQDRDSAGWVLKRLATRQAVIDEINAECDTRVAEKQAEIDAINARRVEMVKGPQQDMLYFTNRYLAELKEWAATEIAKGKTNSVKLTYGDVGYKASGKALVIDDEAAAITLAKVMEIPDAVVETVSLSKKAVGKWLKDKGATHLSVTPEDGKPVVVAHIEGGEDEFYIKPSLPGGK